MNLTDRQNLILNLLFKNSGYLPSEQIADRIGVTNKTVQSDILAMNDFLQDYPISIESLRGKGYRISYESDTRQLEIVNSFLEINEFSDLDYQRAWVVCFLIFTEHAITQKELMDCLLISSNHLREIFERVLKELPRHQLKLHSMPGSGFVLEGDEIYKRLCFVYYFQVLKNSAYYHKLFVQNTKYLEHASNPVDIQIINRGIREKGLMLSRKNQEYLLDYLVFSLNRKYANFGLSHSQIAFGLEDNVVALGQEISANIFESDQIEASYIAAVLKFTVNESSLVPYLKMNQQDAQIIQGVNQFFLGRRALFERSMVSIDALQQEITNSILLIVCKNSLGYREVESEIARFDRDDEYMVAIEFAVLLTFKLENGLRVEFFKDDIYRLATVFNIHFKMDVWDEHQYIYIYSDDSKIKQRYLQRKIEQLTDNVIVTVIDSLDEVKVQHDNVLLITDRDDDFSDLDVRLGTFKSLTRYNEITNYVSSFVSKKERGLKRFLALFDGSRFIKHAFKRRSEIVEYIAEKYKCSTERKATIQENVYIRETRYFGTVVNETAYPRIYVNTIAKPVVEVIQLEKPVLWGGQQIRMVIASVLPNSYTELTILGKPFYDISTNVHLVKRLNEAKDYEHFLLCLSKYLESQQ